jgi:hypothetical protein
MEVKSMLGQNVVPWTERWKQEGRREDLLALQGVLLRNIESRFGRIPEAIRRRIEALDSVPGLGELIARAASVSSLADLGLS